MLTGPEIQDVQQIARSQRLAHQNEPGLGHLELLPGTWANADELVDCGWNMIALPLKVPGTQITPPQPSAFRLLINQYNEILTFSIVDTGVPNRGPGQTLLFDTDQHLAALQYIQSITQNGATDFPTTPSTPDTPKAVASIHREPGLFLNMWSQTDGGPQIARLATVPHGNALTALGDAMCFDGPPSFDHIGDFLSLATGPGISSDLDHDPFHAPYKIFRDAPFKGLFDPTNPLARLKADMPANIKRTTQITVDTTLASGGITSIPFIAKRADATTMRSVFFIEELDAPPVAGVRQIVLQYAQKVVLDFAASPASPNVMIKWPHISVNTMKLVGPPPP